MINTAPMIPTQHSRDMGSKAGGKSLGMLEDMGGSHIHFNIDKGLGISEFWMWQDPVDLDDRDNEVTPTIFVYCLLPGANSWVLRVPGPPTVFRSSIASPASPCALGDH